MNNFFNQFLQRMLPTGSRQVQGNLETEAWNRSMFKESIEQQRELYVPLEQLLITAIDSETTGFHPEAGDEILSLAAVRWKQSGNVLPFHSYIQTKGNIPAHVTDLTGIDDKCLAGAPSLEEGLRTFLDYIGNSIVIGYYVGHDIHFLNYYLWRKFRTRIKNRVIELKTIVELIFPKLEDPSFDHVCDLFEIKNEARHTALGDAKAVIELWRRLMQELTGKDIENLAGLYQELAVHKNKRGK